MVAVSVKRSIIGDIDNESRGTSLQPMMQGGTSKISGTQGRRISVKNFVESNFPRGTTNQKHYPDLGSDASSVWDFLRSFLRRHLAEKPVVASPTVGSFLSLASSKVHSFSARQIISYKIFNCSFESVLSNTSLVVEKIPCHFLINVMPQFVVLFPYFLDILNRLQTAPVLRRSLIAHSINRPGTLSKILTPRSAQMETKWKEVPQSQLQRLSQQAGADYCQQAFILLPL